MEMCLVFPPAPAVWVGNPHSFPFTKKEMRKMAKCPICKGKVTDKITALCESCSDRRFFDNDEVEVSYRKRVQERIKAVKKLFSHEFNDNIHIPMIEQMVRCEINIQRYDRLIANDLETPQTIELLRSERIHWNKLADNLNITIHKIRGDTKNLKHEFPDDFKEYMKMMIKGSSDEEKDED